MPARKKERGPYAGGLARRQKILDTTVALLGEVGYYGLSMRDIARRVGVSHPGVIYHFPTKEALLAAVIERYESQFGVTLDSVEHLEAHEVVRLFLALTGIHVHDPALAQMDCVIEVEAASTGHPAREHYQYNMTRIAKALTRAYKAFEEHGLFKVNTSAADLAQQHLALWRGLRIMWLYDHSVDVQGALRGEIVKAFDILSPHHASLAKYLELDTPQAMLQIQRVTGMTLRDFLDIGLLDVSPDNLSDMGVGHLQIGLVYRILNADVLTVQDIADSYYAHEVPKRVVDKIIASDIVTDRDLVLAKGWDDSEEQDREEAIRQLFAPVQQEEDPQGK